MTKVDEKAERSGQDKVRDGAGEHAQTTQAREALLSETNKPGLGDERNQRSVAESNSMTQSKTLPSLTFVNLAAGETDITRRLKGNPGQKPDLAESKEPSASVERTSFSAPRPIDTGKAFTDIAPQEAAGWLSTPPGKAIPPIAERFEEKALQQLGPERRPDIYVSKNAGDKNLPAGARVYGSINEAVKNAAEGSVIQVMPGVYNEKINLGEKQSNLTLQTDRQNPAVIDGGGFRVSSGTHDLTIRNFEIKNFSGMDSGIRIDGSNIHDITIAGNNVHDARNAEGIAVYGRPGTPVSNINIIGNRVHDLKLAELEAMPVNGNVEGFKIIGNSGYKLNNLFIDAIGGEGNGGNRDQARKGVIAYNFADGISSKTNSSYSDYSAAGIYSDGAKSLEIYGNYVRNSDFGIEIGSEHRGLNSSDMKVHDNILENSHLEWLKLGYKGGVDNSTIKDNLILNNKLSDIEREGPVASSVKVESNIAASDRQHITQIPTSIAAQMMWEQSKPEQPKPEQPKPEQPKPEQPKPEQPKPEQPKPEQPKPEQPKPEQPKPEQPKPEQPKPEQPKSEFALPESVLSKAHPHKGQGYYEPLGSSFEELLGRQMSDGETRALIAAARAMRKDAGKPVNCLSTHDCLLPTTRESAQKFIDNIGNSKYGRQLLGKEKLSHLKQEVKQKFATDHEPEKPVPPKTTGKRRK